MSYLRATYETLGEVNPIGLMSRIEHNAIGWDDTPIFERPAWQAEAACREMDVSVFFGGRGQVDQWDEARKVCADCPVRSECLEYGLHEHHGFWGGLSERERRKLRRGRPLPKRRCECCRAWFQPDSPLRVFCSDPCRKRKHAQSTAEHNRRTR